MMKKIKIGAKYQHYKGNIYKVIAVGRDSEDPQKELVVYKALYDSPEFGKDQVWVRSKEDFQAKVVKDGKTVLRFEEVSERKDD